MDFLFYCFLPLNIGILSDLCIFNNIKKVSILFPGNNANAKSVWRDGHGKLWRDGHGKLRVKPIFHQNAKLLALGTFASANAKDSTFA